MFAVRGQVLPAAGQAVVLHAEMEDGSIITGESKIPEAGGRIKRVFLEPDHVEPLPEAVEAIRQADAILIGPGSLYTSILPNLLVPKLAEAVVETDAVKMFICNVMTQPGETDNYTVSDHLKAVQEHIGHQLFDYVIVNNGDIPLQVQNKYAEKGAKPVVLDMNVLKVQGIRLSQIRWFCSKPTCAMMPISSAIIFTSWFKIDVTEEVKSHVICSTN